MKLFVADAKYRSVGLKYDTTRQSHGNPQLLVTLDYFNGAADNRTEALPYTKGDAWIQRTYAELRGDGTAKSNTDFLMEFDGTEAAHHCRNQDIPGIGPLDLPNLYELIILYLESDNIDALDPTVESNRDKALGVMNTNGRFGLGSLGHVWASTERSSIYAWYATYQGNAQYSQQFYDRGVAPVRELDA